METITNLHGVAKWHWYDVMGDLEKAGLTGIVIDPLSTTAHGCGGTWQGIKFYFSWAKDALLMVTMDKFNQQLMDAFATVVEYRPFCRYSRDGMVTVEWNKTDAEKILAELQTDSRVANLERVN